MFSRIIGSGVITPSVVCKAGPIALAIAQKWQGPAQNVSALERWAQLERRERQSSERREMFYLAFGDEDIPSRFSLVTPKSTGDHTVLSIQCLNAKV
jgi:hypothetical protein